MHGGTCGCVSSPRKTEHLVEANTALDSCFAWVPARLTIRVRVGWRACTQRKSCWAARGYTNRAIWGDAAAPLWRAQAQLAIWDYDDFSASPLVSLSTGAPPAAAPLVVQSALPRALVCAGFLLGKAADDTTQEETVQ